MKRLLRIAALITVVCSGQLLADSAVSVLGEDYTFPAKIEGLPARISDFEGLQINSFQTSDGVKLSYWEAGEGEPLIFLPGWSAGGAEHINLLYMLSKKYHVFVLGNV
ncbi:alpha/beta fold hydrolase [Pseudomonas sp.]|uniref:alpha/beta fold hydrolase n=1 Tax=Pseudomonas sp. TaxID=306 RepID=UPI00272B987F|nr:hypothetical protein [Pseudomonas sp.]